MFKNTRSPPVRGCDTRQRCRAVTRHVLKTVFLFLFLLLCIGVMVLSADRIRPYIVLSGSMEPTIPTGSLVLADRKARDLSPGDVITFVCGGESITHRIVAVKKEYFQTKGDANETTDFGTIHRRQIVGKVFLVIPCAGYLLYYLKTHLLLFCFFILILYFTPLVSWYFPKSQSKNSP